MYQYHQRVINQVWVLHLSKSRQSPSHSKSFEKATFCQNQPSSGGQETDSVLTHLKGWTWTLTKYWQSPNIECWIKTCQQKKCCKRAWKGIFQKITLHHTCPC